MQDEPPWVVGRSKRLTTLENGVAGPAARDAIDAVQAEAAVVIGPLGIGTRGLLPDAGMAAFRGLGGR
jgi:hypothetical protein